MKTLLFLLAGLVPAFAQTTATLSVTADGTTPFSYSWKKDGALIAGATSSNLVLSPLTAASSGLYLAQVVNAAGSAVAPANLVVLASSSGTAPAADFSKMSVQASLAGPWSPTPGIFPSFVIAPLKKTDDPGNHWNDAASSYTVGPGEGGTYVLELTVRTQDNPPFSLSIGLTAGTDNLDSKTLWTTTPADPHDPTVYIHFGAFIPITRKLNAGDVVHVNIFVAKALSIIGYDLNLWRKY